ncbi:MAG: DMT family transporter [Bacteroidetes bacterium]|nr:DMT family transporter [Bacteroidota bacterium]
MGNNVKFRAFLFLHTAVFLWGFTAILGKLISYGSFVLVWHRMCLTALVYFLFPKFWHYLKQMKRKDIFIFLGIGCIVCVHWLTFYGSIKLGNSASVTLACLGSASFFTALLEPVLMKKKIKIAEVFLGLLVMLGILVVYFAIPKTDSKNIHTSLAIITGVISAFLAALFTALNKKYIERTHVLAISALEMAGGALLMSVIILFAFGEKALFIPEWNIQTGNYDLLWIMLLVVVCTNFTFYLGAHSLQFLSAFTSNLSVNLEPVYGMVLGAIIFHENKDLNAYFYLGSGLILLSVFIQTFMEYYRRKNADNANQEFIIRE